MAKPTRPSRWRNAQTGFISSILALALRLWSTSWRKDDTELARIDKLLAANNRLLLVFWHGKYQPLFTLFEGRKAMVLTAQSFRGEVIEKICRKFGYISVQIPLHKPGEAYPFVRDTLQLHKSGALAIDGPLGPYHEVKPGAIRLAADLDFLLVPVSVASHPKRTMNNRWDKLELPYPFARVALAVGDPIHVPSGLSRKARSEWRAKLKLALARTDQAAEERLKRKC